MSCHHDKPRPHPPLHHLFHAHSPFQFPLLPSLAHFYRVSAPTIQPSHAQPSSVRQSAPGGSPTTPSHPHSLRSLIRMQSTRQFDGHAYWPVYTQDFFARAIFLGVDASSDVQRVFYAAFEPKISVLKSFFDIHIIIIYILSSLKHN